jgi:prepilin-type N-terminal cleavage/methylation domain-containing protein
MQKYLKNNKGFTLVEVIVVAVIVLVLAAVAIPLYNGYIQDSRANVASNSAASIAAMYVAAAQIGVPVTASANGTGLVVTAANDGNSANTLALPNHYYYTDETASGIITVTYSADGAKSVTATAKYADK